MNETALWEESARAAGWAAPLTVAVLLGVALIAYLCGCLNGAVIVSKYILRDDIRAHGSGNAGLTNFHRTFGGKLTAVVLLLDVVKMVLAVLLGVLICRFTLDAIWNFEGAVYAKYWAGLWCLLGHMFPVTFGFKGGKGILSGGTLTFLIDWRMGLVAIGIFLVLTALTRYVSLGSVCAAASFPVSTALFVSRQPVILALSVFLGALIIWMHRGNLQRLAAGTERKFSLHHKKE